MPQVLSHTRVSQKKAFLLPWRWTRKHTRLFNPPLTMPLVKIYSCKNRENETHKKLFSYAIDPSQALATNGCRYVMCHHEIRNAISAIKVTKKKKEPTISNDTQWWWIINHVANLNLTTKCNDMVSNKLRKCINTTHLLEILISSVTPTVKLTDMLLVG